MPKMIRFFNERYVRKCRWQIVGRCMLRVQGNGAGSVRDLKRPVAAFSRADAMSCWGAWGRIFFSGALFFACKVEYRVVVF
jgi:hypothetical protein